MRTAMLLAVMALAGCAAQPSMPQVDAAAAPGTAAAGSAAATATGSPGTAAAASTELDSKRLALAQKMHLKLVNQDGEEVFCKSSIVTGSHLRTETRCYTAAEMDRMEERTQRDVDQLNKMQSHAVNPGLPSN